MTDEQDPRDAVIAQLSVENERLRRMVNELRTRILDTAELIQKAQSRAAMDYGVFI